MKINSSLSNNEIQFNSICCGWTQDCVYLLGSIGEHNKVYLTLSTIKNSTHGRVMETKSIAYQIFLFSLIWREKQTSWFFFCCCNIVQKTVLLKISSKMTLHLFECFMFRSFHLCQLLLLPNKEDITPMSKWFKSSGYR